MGKFKKFLTSGVDISYETKDDYEKEDYEKKLKNNHKEEPKKKNKSTKKINLLAIIGFMLGLLSIFLGFGIIPLLAIIFSAIALKWKDKRVLAIIGLILGIIYFTVNLYQYGHLDFGSRTSEEQMIKMGLCYDVCIAEIDYSTGFSGKANKLEVCLATCNEKYGITSEEYKEWKEDNKQDAPKKSLNDFFKERGIK